MFEKKVQDVKKITLFFGQRSGIFKMKKSTSTRFQRVFSISSIVILLLPQVFLPLNVAQAARSVRTDMVEQSAQNRAVAGSLFQLPSIHIESNKETYATGEQAEFSIEILNLKAGQVIKAYFPTSLTDVTNSLVFNATESNATKTVYDFTSEVFTSPGKQTLTSKVLSRRMNKVIAKSAHDISVIAPTLHFTSPSSEEYFSIHGNATVETELEYNDGDLQQSDLQVFLDDVEVTNQFLLESHKGHATLMNVSQGEHTLRATIKESGSLITQTETTFNHTIDTVPPEFTIDNFASGDTIKTSSFSIEGSLTEDHLEQVTYSVVQNSEERITDQPIAVPADGQLSIPVSVVEGENQFIFYAFDKAGWETAYTLTLFADFAGPALDFVSPQDQATVTCTIAVTGTTDDIEATHLLTVKNPWNKEHQDENDGQGYIREYAVTDVAPQGDGTGGIEQTVELVNGQNIIDLSATDSAGNVSFEEQFLYCDQQAPRLDVLSPKNSESIYQNTAIIEVEYSDFLSSIQPESFAVVVRNANGEDITHSLNIDISTQAPDAGKNVYKTTGIIAGFSSEEVFTIEAQVADVWNNTAIQTAEVYAAKAHITPPQAIEESGMLYGTVVDASTCDEYGLHCAGIAGAEITLTKGVLVVNGELLEEPETIAGTAVSGPEGKFSFPTPETDTYWLTATHEGYTYSQRALEVVNQKDTTAGTLILSPTVAATMFDDADGDGVYTAGVDTEITEITSESGGMATAHGAESDEQSWDITVDIPVGAVKEGETIDELALTWFEHVEQLPSGELPEGTQETYAFDLSGGVGKEHIEFNEPVTVQFTNTRNFPTYFPDRPGELMKIPVGYWNNETFAWEHVGQAEAHDPDGDGIADYFAFTTTHFSPFDCNDSVAPPEEGKKTDADENDENEKVNQCEADSANCLISYGSGDLHLKYSLPVEQFLGSAETVQLTYNSGNAKPSALISSSTTLENADTGEYTNLQWQLDVAGKEVDRVYYSIPGSGKYQHQFFFDGRNAAGELLQTGIYPTHISSDADYLGQYYYSADGRFGGEPDLESGATGVYQEFTQTGGFDDKVAIHNEAASAYGSGWTLNEMQTYTESEDGFILVTDGHDSDTFLNISHRYDDVEYVDTQKNASASAAAEQKTATEKSTIRQKNRKVELQTKRLLKKRTTQRNKNEQNTTENKAEATVTQPYVSQRTATAREVSGTINSNTHWTIDESPYIITANTTIAAGVTLTIDPGVVVKFKNKNYYLRVEGHLNAIGAAGDENAIVFTSYKDDAHGGDTNGDGNGSSAQKGDWRNILFANTGSGNIEYASIQYGGYGDYGNNNTMVAIDIIVGNAVTFSHVNLSDSSVDNMRLLNGNRGAVNISNSSVSNAGDYGIYINGGSATITNSTIADNGNNLNFGNDLNDGLYINGESATIYNNTISGNGGNGIDIQKESVTVTDNIIANNGSYSEGLSDGVYLNGVAPTMTNNTITGSGRAAVRVNNPSTAIIENTFGHFNGTINTLADNGFDGIFFTGTTNGSFALPATTEESSLPYAIADVTIAASDTVTINPGAVIKFTHNNSTIQVRGTLIAKGTKDNEIVFTSYKDDVHGGDSNGDGDASSPQKGDWNNISFQENGSGYFDYTVIQFGGYGNYGNNDTMVEIDASPVNEVNINNSVLKDSESNNIQLRNGLFHLRNSTVSDAGDDGIYMNSGSAKIEGNTISHNGENGITILSNAALAYIFANNIVENSQFGLLNHATYLLDARYNWWGDVSGPYHSSTNTEGLGNRVSDMILFDPWLDEEVRNEVQIVSLSKTDYSVITFDADETSPEYLTYSRTYLDGTKVHFNVDGSHDYTADRLGNKTQYTYNTNGAVAAKSIIPAGSAVATLTWVFDYDENGKLQTITNPSGSQTTFTIDGKGNLLEIQDPELGQRSFSYDEDHLALSKTIETGETFTYEYNDYGRIIESSAPEQEIIDTATSKIIQGQEVRTYTPSETEQLINDTVNPITGTPDNAAIPVLYDDVLATSSDADGSTTRKMNKFGSSISTSDSLGRTTIKYRDDKNNLIQTTYPAGNAVYRTYDDQGYVLSESQIGEPLDLSAGYPAVESLPETAITTLYAYEETYHQLKTITDANGNSTTNWYDYEFDTNADGQLTADDEEFVAYQAAYTSQGSQFVGNMWKTVYPETEVYNSDSDTTELVVPTGYATYNVNGQILTVTDARGIVTKYTYTQDAHSYLTEIIEDCTIAVNALCRNGADGVNRTTRFQNFDGFGNYQTSIDSNGTVTNYEYDPEDGMNTAEIRFVDLDHDGVQETIRTEYAYDETNKLVQQTQDAGGAQEVVTEYTYNAHDQLLSSKIIDTSTGQNITTQQVYDVNRNIAKEIDGNGNISLHEYDSENQVIKKIQGWSADNPAGEYFEEYTYVGSSGCETCVSRGGTGQIDTITYPNGSVAKFIYDEYDRTIQEIQNYVKGGAHTAEQNLYTTYVYDDNNNVLTTTTPDGVITKQDYDALNKVRSATQDYTQDGVTGYNLTSQYFYDPVGNQVLSINERNIQTKMLYDSLSRVGAVTEDFTVDPGAGLNLTTKNTYDKNGNVETVTDHRGIVSKQTYDEFNRAIATTADYTADGTSGENLVTQYTFDRLGNPARVVDPSGMETKTRYNNFSQLVKETIDDGGENILRSYIYDNNFNQLSVADSHTNITSYAYDALNRQTKTIYPDGTEETDTYTLQGNLDTKTTQNNDVLDYNYDALNRLSSTAFADGTAQTFTYDKMGRMLTAEDSRNASVVTNTYNAFGDVGTSRQSINGQAKTVSYGYDYAGGESTLSYPSGEEITKTVDSLERLDTVENASETIADYTYNDADNNWQRGYGNGVTTTNSADDVGRFVSVDSSIAEYVYTYDDAGNRTSMQRGHAAGNNYDAYQFDGAYRITGVKYAANNSDFASVTAFDSSTSYTLDQLGNRIELDEDGATTEYGPNNGSKLLDEMNQYQTVDGDAFAYDDNGNLLQDHQNTYVFDELNRLTSVVNAEGVTTTYLYDAQGRRIQKDIDGATTKYVYDGDQIIEEQSSTGTLLRSFVYGDSIDEPLQFVDDATGEAYFYHFDALGSVTELSNEAGNLVEAYEYDIYGNFRIFTDAARTTEISYSASLKQPYLFTARQYDPESENYHYRARYYSPDLGRFISTDPLGYIDGMNQYEYVKGNSVLYTDPTGEWAETGVDVAFIAYDIQDIRSTRSSGQKVCTMQWLALGADVGSAFIPFFAGGGLIVRGAKGANAVNKASKTARLVDKAADAGKVLDKAGDVGKSGSLRFTQTTASKFFSQEGKFAGKTIGDVSKMLRSGKLSSLDVPVEFVIRDGKRLIVNTRSSIALKRAGIPVSQWDLVNRTSNTNIQKHVTKRLIKNKLKNSGTETLRITGSRIPRSSSLD